MPQDCTQSTSTVSKFLLMKEHRPLSASVFAPEPFIMHHDNFTFYVSTFCIKYRVWLGRCSTINLHSAIHHLWYNNWSRWLCRPETIEVYYIWCGGTVSIYWLRARFEILKMVSWKENVTSMSSCATLSKISSICTDPLLCSLSWDYYQHFSQSNGIIDMIYIETGFFLQFKRLLILCKINHWWILYFSPANRVTKTSPASSLSSFS